MITGGLTPSPSAALGIKPYSLKSIKPSLSRYYQNKFITFKQERRPKSEICRAALSADAPVAIAIGACILSSLVIPEVPPLEDDEAESFTDSADARFAVMGIISFIPYFNWMSWLFAWLDTQKPRYAVYAVVYLAPYLRSNLSISPEESWLPIASIALCIIHIQLEASIRNGDIRGFQVFNEAAKHLSSIRKSQKISKETEERNDFHNLPSPQEHYRSKIRDWATTQNQQQDSETINGGDKDSKGDSVH